MRKLIAALLIAASAAHAQTIEVRKVRTLIDPSGKAFSQAPYMVAALPGGRYAIQETNVVPVVIDSTGRLVKRFGRGGGPGEFQYFAYSLTTIGDTLYAGNGESYNVYSPDLKFVRTMRLPGISAGPLSGVGAGFALASQKYQNRFKVTSIHVVRPSGDLVASFLSDTVLPRQSPPSYRVAAAADGNLWVVSTRGHRIDKWSTDGRRLSTFASVPAWFDSTRAYADGLFYVRDVVESDGVLWIMTQVPVPDYRKIMEEVFRGRSGEVDGRLVPSHRLSTIRLEAYDAGTGRLLADLPVKAHAVGMVNARQFMTYSEGADDQPRLEIWEMKLKR